MELKVITAPARLPLDISDVQEFLRLDTQNDLETVQNLIKAAGDITQSYTNRTLIQTEYQLFHDFLPNNIDFEENFLRLRQGSIIAVSELKIHNDDASTEILTDFILTNEHMDGTIYPLSTRTWNTNKTLRYKKAVEITYTAGYGANRSDIPDGLINVMLQIIVFLYENREGDSKTLPTSIINLLDAYRIVTI